MWRGKVDPVEDIDIINFELALAGHHTDREAPGNASPRGRAKTKEEIATNEVQPALLMQPLPKADHIRPAQVAPACATRHARQFGHCNRAAVCCEDLWAQMAACRDYAAVWQIEKPALERIVGLAGPETSRRGAVALSEEESALVKNLQLLTMKPMIYAGQCGRERPWRDQGRQQPPRQGAQREGRPGELRGHHCVSSGGTLRASTSAYVFSHDWLV